MSLSLAVSLLKLLTYIVSRSTQLPILIRMRNKYYLMDHRGTCQSLVRLNGAVVCLLVADCGSNCSLTRALDGRIVRCGIISSYQPAATSEIV